MNATNPNLDILPAPSLPGKWCDLLDIYMTENVLDGDKFICAFAAQCRASCEGKRVLYEGQLCHVGANYDLVVINGRETRKSEGKVLEEVTR